jgi:hypothetical protein
VEKKMSFDPVSVAKDFASAYYEQLMGANWRGLAEWYLPEAIYSRTDEETGVATPISTVNVRSFLHPSIPLIFPSVLIVKSGRKTVTKFFFSSSVPPIFFFLDLLR